jgi:hypothetical protein
MNNLLFLIAIPIILLTSLYGTQFAFSDLQIYTSKGDLTAMALDSCTPYSMHIGMNITMSDNQTLSCASLLGQLKWVCGLDPMVFSRSEPFPACSDPRYTNWLVNDYGVYPPGTWDFADHTPTGVPDMVRP